MEEVAFKLLAKTAKQIHNYFKCSIFSCMKLFTISQIMSRGKTEGLVV
jgi:hypothetical protein